MFGKLTLQGLLLEAGRQDGKPAKELLDSPGGKRKQGPAGRDDVANRYKKS